MYKKGFSLVELSIVLIIIGLLVSGVAAGQKLIKNAKFRKIITNFTDYESAFNTFRLTYDAVPGDMKNAFSFWASCGGGNADACNGNGDEKIIIGHEDRVAWEHMSLAGVISGGWSYNATYVLGTNIVPAPINGGGYWMWKSFSAYDFKAIISLGSKRTSIADFNGEIMTPADAYALDRKYDDGEAGKGKFTVLRNQDLHNSNICINKSFGAADIADASYLLTDSTTSCFIQWLLLK